MKYSAANTNSWQNKQRVTIQKESVADKRAAQLEQCEQQQGNCLSCFAFTRPDECPLNKSNPEHLKALRIAELQRKIDFLNSRTPTAATLIADYSAKIQALQAN